MKPAGFRTRAVVKLMLATDPAVEAFRMNLVLDVLDGNLPPGVGDGTPLPQVVHRRQVMEALGVCSRTVDNLLSRGLLTPVRGIGRKVIGYTEESVRRLVEGHAVDVKEAFDGRE